MHGANEAREGHLLEFVVDEVADGVGEGEAGRSGCQGGPVYGDGHLHDFWCLLCRMWEEGVVDLEWAGYKNMGFISERLSPAIAIRRWTTFSCRVAHLITVF